MKGSVAYEYQFGRLGVRILRPKYYFWPRREYGRIVWPNFIRVRIYKGNP